MSKLFSDPEYHRMSTDEESWLELAIEPFRFYLNDIVHQLPSKIELNFNDILEILKGTTSDRYLSIEPAKILEAIISDSTEKELSSYELELLEKMYEVDVAENTVIDFTEKTMSSPIVLSKQQDEIPEEQIKEICATLADSHINMRDYRPGTSSHSESISRSNEIIDIIGYKDDRARKTRSIGTKEGFIKRRIREIIIEDEWRIRNYEILVDLCKNVTSYINNGNMHALMNVTRLKCMTHKGAPIYSMEEIK